MAPPHPLQCPWPVSSAPPLPQPPVTVVSSLPGAPKAGAVLAASESLATRTVPGTQQVLKMTVAGSVEEQVNGWLKT